MRRDRLTLVAALLTFGLFVPVLAVQSSADDKQDKAVAKDVKFACSQHGPSDMMLTLSLETGAARKIEFIGGNSATKWFVKIDGQDVQVPKQTTVKVRSGDTITWSVAQGTHGVAFAEQDLAQAMLDFDTTVGKPLIDLTTILATNSWKRFGAKRWGTDRTNQVGVLASCKVKE